MKHLMNSDNIRDFALFILPWVERATGMKRKEGFPLPEFVAFSDNEELNSYINSHDPDHGGGQAAGGYSPDLNRLIVDVSARNGDWNYVKSIIVHELTHYLQHMNNKLDRNFRMKAELEAYVTQGSWLKYEKGIDPRVYGMTRESVIKRALVS